MVEGVREAVLIPGRLRLDCPLTKRVVYCCEERERRRSRRTSSMLFTVVLPSGFPQILQHFPNVFP